MTEGDNRVWVAYRVFDCVATRAMVPMRSFDSEEAAKRFVEEAVAETNAMLNNAVAAPATNGSVQMMMRVGEFLQDMGIKSVGYAVIPVEVEGKIRLTHGPRLIIPS